MQVLSYATLLSFPVFVHSCHLPANLVLSIIIIPRAPTGRRVKGVMQKVLLDRSYVLGFNLAIIVLIIELFIYLDEVSFILKDTSNGSRRRFEPLGACCQYKITTIFLPNRSMASIRTLSSICWMYISCRLEIYMW